MEGGRQPAKKLLRFLTAGSVDDGKSTLIGRLLHDTRGVCEDEIDSLRRASRNGLAEGIDLAMITDGLRAEREQGITIDVAYRYFSTPRRKFIIADAPGHEQYTRNMATAASTADLAVFLVDATLGVLPQSRRHAFIASLLGVRLAVVAVNKMDLVDFRQDVFEAIRGDFSDLLGRLQFEAPYFVPVSALDGDNVVTRSARTPWFDGPSLLDRLEAVEVAEAGAEPFRFPVQLVLRPNAVFRGYAGQVASGRVRTGDPILVSPSGSVSRVSSIGAWGGDLAEAAPPQCVALCLEDHLDIGRGDLLSSPEAPPAVSREFAATLIWMSASPLRCDNPYLLKHTSRQVCANVRRVRHTIDIQTLAAAEARDLALNDIGEVEIETHQPLCFDPYAANRTTGSFILIDLMPNHTVAAGMILENLALQAAPARVAVPQRGLTVWFTGLSGAGKTSLCRAVAERLAMRGCRLEILDGDVVREHLSKGLGFSREDRDENIRRVGFVAGLLTRHGVIVLAAAISPYRAVRDEVRAEIGDFIEVYVNAPLEVCEARDTKGLYQRARAGLIRGFTGIDDPYEPPLRPEVECRTDRETVRESVEKVLSAIDRALN